MPAAFDFDGGLTCALTVSNLDRSFAWYRDMLGFEIVYKMDEMGWGEMKTPVERVHVGLSQVESVTSGAGGATLTFGVKDIDAARAHLQKHDVRFDGETREIPDMVKLATFFDPDGNTLMFYQDLS